MIELRGVKKTAIFTHIRPDGDAYGSMLGLRTGLTALGIAVDCYCDSPTPFALSRIPYADTVISTPIKDDYDLVISVDCADELRLGMYKDKFLNHPNSINIDHHITNSRYAKHNIIKPLSSTCEIILQVVRSIKVELTQVIAECLYTGLITDTGLFSQANTTAESHIAAAELIRAGVNVEDVSLKMFKETTASKLYLIRDAISSMRFFGEGAIALIPLSQKNLAEYGLSLSDTEGIISYAINIRDVKIGVCLTESARNAYKVSLRSKQGVNVSNVAAGFGGGGHIQAAGCMVNGPLESVIEKLVRQCVIELDR